MYLREHIYVCMHDCIYECMNCMFRVNYIALASR